MGGRGPSSFFFSKPKAAVSGPTIRVRVKVSDSVRVALCIKTRPTTPRQPQNPISMPAGLRVRVKVRIWMVACERTFLLGDASKFFLVSPDS